jgi:hypothetical protein
VAGHTFQQIADRLGVSLGAAYKMVSLELEKLNDQSAESARELRVLEANRLDALHAAHWPAAVGADGQPPDLRAAALVLRISERRSQLLGLDASRQIETRNSSRVSVEELVAMSESLGIPLPYGLIDDPRVIDQPAVLPLSQGPAS